jgi:hypothetical protein
LLDRVFQNFVNKLGNFHNNERPIQLACQRLKHYQQDAIDRALTRYDVSSIPNLYLPSSLTAQPQERERLPGMDKQPRGEGRKRDPSWWTQNPGIVPAWKIPAGKTYSDFYDSRIPALKDQTLN